MMPVQWLTAEQVAGQLGLKVQAVREIIQQGKLKAYKPGRRLLIDPDDLEQYVRSHVRTMSRRKAANAKTA